MSRSVLRRDGFSLLEIVIATAILTATALSLVSLLGLGVRFGTRAELKAIGLVKAESVMDEYLASLAFNSTTNDREEAAELTGLLLGEPELHFVVRAEKVESGDAEPRDALEGLQIITVSIYEESQEVGSEGKHPIAELSRLVRLPKSQSRTNTLGERFP